MSTSAERAHRADPLSALAFRDPAVTHAVLALVHAAEAGAPDLYAATAAQYLATHLLSRHSAWGTGADDRRRPGPLTDQRLARVVEYMGAHFAEPLSLERLGAEAAISKLHLVRLFRAAAVGYASAAHFTRAFARHHGRTRTAFRAEAAGSNRPLAAVGSG